MLPGSPGFTSDFYDPDPAWASASSLEAGNTTRRQQAQLHPPLSVPLCPVTVTAAGGEELLSLSGRKIPGFFLADQRKGQLD